MFAVLSRLLSNAKQAQNLKDVEIAKGIPQTHLFFANDALLFNTATQAELYTIMNILNDFSNASGQRINLLKSGVVFSIDILGEEKCSLAAMLGILVWENAGAYLGVPADWG